MKSVSFNNSSKNKIKMIKNLITIFLFIFVSQIVSAQEHVFIKNEETARYEMKKNGTQILTTNFVLEKDQLTQSIQDYIIQLMEEKDGFISIEFVSTTEVKVKYQETIAEAYVLKMINRKGLIFKRKPIAVFNPR